MTQAIESIPLSNLSEDPLNPRKAFADIDELAQDVKQHGILQPLLVRPNGKGYKVVFGARRFRAAKSAGLAEVPAMVRELEDLEALELMIVENTQRSDIHPLEEADGYRQLHEEHGYHVDEIAAKVGKSKAYVYARMKLCALTEPARKAFFDGELSASTALLIARIPDPGLQAQATKEILEPQWEREALSYRQAVELIQDDFMLRLGDAKFSTTDAELVPAAGACSACPKRTGNQPELFADVKSADVCTDPTCYKSKLDAHWKNLKAEAPVNGHRVLSAQESKKAFHGGTYLVHNSGLVDLDDKADYPHHNKTYRQIIKSQNAEIQPVLARDGSGNIRELGDERAVKRLLPKADRSKSAAPTRSESQRREERKKRARKAAAKDATARIAEEAVDSEPGADFWRVLAVLAYRSAHSSPANAVLKRHGITPAKESYGPARSKKLLSSIAKYSAGEARALVLELLLGDVFDYYYGDAFPHELVEASKLFTVDLKALEKNAIAKATPKKKTPIRKRKAVKK